MPPAVKSVVLTSITCLILLFTVSPAFAASSDYNNDGRDDILTLYNYGAANTGLIAMTSGVGSFSPSLAWSSGPGNWDWSRSQVVPGDYNNDNLDDLLVLYDYGNANTGAIVLQSDGTTFTSRLAWLSGAGNWDWSRAKITAGDFNGDGRTDIMALYDYGNSNTGAIVLQSDGTTFAPRLAWSSGPGNWDWSRTKLAAGDFNNDGRDDIAALYDYGNANTGAIVLQSDGTTFTPRLAWSSGPGNWDLGRSKFGAGDYNADGRDDIIALYDKGNTRTDITVLESDGVNLTLNAIWSSGPGNWDLGRTKIDVGDFNTDGRADIMALYDYGSANSGAIVLEASGTTFASSLLWSSGPGNWQWMRTKVANGFGQTFGFEPLTYRIGASVLGRDLSAFKIGNGGRRFLFIAGHHGDETQGMSEIEIFLRYLCYHPEVVPDNVEVWLIPCLNPDGLAAGTRWNARGVNLNRNYGTNDWGLYDVTMLSTLQAESLAPMTDFSAIITGTPYSFNYPGPYPFSEPETQAVASLCSNTGFLAMVSLHEEEGCVYWGQTGAALAYVVGGRTGLPVAGPVSISGDATRWFGQATGNPSVTLELSSYLSYIDAGAAFNTLLPGFMGVVNY